MSHSIVPRLQSEWEKEIRKCHGSVNNVCKNNFYYYNFYYKIIVIIIFTITAIGIQTLYLIVKTEMARKPKETMVLIKYGLP